MSDLSHEEIDALLDEAAEAEEEAAASESVAEVESEDEVSRSGHIEFFDFQQPHSLSRNFERTLRSVCESFSKTATLSFSNLLRVNCVFTYSGLKVSSFGQSFASVENPSCIGVTTMRPLSGIVLVTLDAGTMFSCFTKLLGGPIEAPGQLRDFTDIEMNMASKILDRVLEQFHVAAEKVVSLEPVLTQIENNPNYLNIYGESDTILTLQYTITLDELSGTLNFFVPLAAFEPVREQFDPTENLDSRTGMGAGDRRKVRQTLERTPVDMSVRLSGRSMSLSELRSIEPGQVVDIGHPTSRPLQVMVEGRPMFDGSLGQVGKTRAVRILRRREEK